MERARLRQQARPEVGVSDQSAMRGCSIYWRKGVLAKVCNLLNHTMSLVQNILLGIFMYLTIGMGQSLQLNQVIQLRIFFLQSEAEKCVLQGQVRRGAHHMLRSYRQTAQ